MNENPEENIKFRKFLRQTLSPTKSIFKFIGD